MSTCSGLKPASTCCSLTKLRASRPAVTSSADASAISATTSALRSRVVRRPALVRVPLSCSDGRTSSVASCQAGSSPNNVAARQATIAEKRSTVQSTCTLWSRGKSSGSTARRKRTPASVSAKPQTAPGIASNSDSAIDCRTSRHRPAPRANRTARSPRRPALLASSRLETLAHVISITSEAASISRRMPSVDVPTTSARRGTARTAHTVSPAFVMRAERPVRSLAA